MEHQFVKFSRQKREHVTLDIMVTLMTQLLKRDLLDEVRGLRYHVFKFSERQLAVVIKIGLVKNLQK